MGRTHKLHFTSAIWMHTLMVENLSRYEKIEPLQQLHHFRVIDHRYVKQSIVWHGIRCLPVTMSIAYTHRHHLAFNNITVYLNVHLVVFPPEHQQYEREYERQYSRTEETTGLLS